ncbi:MAG: PAS domain S-box protein [Candidatus Accumulibacter sp. UW20]
MTTDNEFPAIHPLRPRAEAIAQETGFAWPPESMSPEALRRALHELQVHQIELEIQNEELRRVQVELEAARARYFDLYHLAPVSYCALSGEGLILEANLTFASLFGISRGLLLMRPIVRLIADEDQDIYFLYRRQLLATGKPQTSELRMVKADGTTFWARLEATAMRDRNGELLCQLAISDLSERRHAEDALRESQQRFSLFMDALPAAAFIKDAQGTILFVNRYLADIMGGQAWLGKSTRDLFPPEVAEQMVADDQRAMASGFLVTEEQVRHPDGRWRCYQTYKFSLPRSGRPPLLGGIALDISERKRTEEALREQEKFFRLITENLRGFVAVLDVDGRRVYNSPSYARLLGQEDPSGSSSFANIHPADRERVMKSFRETVATGIGQHLEYRFVMASGDVRLMESRGGVIKDEDGRTRRVVVVSNDVTERKEAEARILHLAFHDPLTHLPNRLTLKDRLSQAMAASKRRGRYGALMFVDLDNFKPVNDTHGHDAGDCLLIEAANRLRACVREMDTVARFGGDEFVVMLSTLHANQTESASQAGIVAEKIRLALVQPYQLTIRREDMAEQTLAHQCTASLGVALFFDHQASQDDLLKWADAAMYQAKESGGNLIRFHDPKA